jgi:hypothetical protein
VIDGYGLALSQKSEVSLLLVLMDCIIQQLYLAWPTSQTGSVIAIGPIIVFQGIAIWGSAKIKYFDRPSSPAVHLLKANV